MSHTYRTPYGYTLLVRVRDRKKRRRVNGRARGFYLWQTVELRVTGPDGVARHFHLGTPTTSAAAGEKAVGENGGDRDVDAIAGELAGGWEKRGGESGNNRHWRARRGKRG